MFFAFGGGMRSNQVPDLRSLFWASQSSVIALDWKSGRLVDRENMRFLARLKAARNELRNCPQHIHGWVAQQTDEPAMKIDADEGE